MKTNNKLNMLVRPGRLFRPTRLAPLACRDERGRLVASVFCAADVTYVPRIVMLFIGSPFRVCSVDTLLKHDTSWASEVYATAICAYDTGSIIAGTADGFVMLLNVLEGRRLIISKVHDEAVVYVDYWNGHVVSVGHDKALKVSHLHDGMLIAGFSEAKLVDIPITAKLFCTYGVLKVLVAFRGSSHLQVYEIGRLNFLKPTVRFVGSIDLQNIDSGGHGLVDLVLDETRTRFAAAFDNKSSLHILIGFLVDFTNTQHYVVSSGEDAYSESKLAWSSTGRGMWVLDNNGAISKVRLPDGRVFTDVIDHQNAITHMHPCCIDGDEALITGSTNKRITRWR